MPKKTNNDEFNFAKIEKKWQDKWKKEKVFEVNIDSKKPKFYILEMYPYPSGSGLHMGHAFNYTIGDIYARMKRMQGFNVLYPMGYDSFGLPAENAAIKAGDHPKKHTNKTVKNFIKQQKEIGLSYDWSKMIASHYTDYYKWNQFWFLKFFEKGLVYRKKAPVNWCPKCRTVLANEQVHNGRCWRHEDTEVEIRHLEQWFIKTTDYAEELLEKVDDLDWPQRVKVMQKNWIGKSRGTEIEFDINGDAWKIFTTRPDTIFGVTFMVVSAQHHRLMDLVTKEQKSEVKEFLKKIKSTKKEDADKMDKEGVFTGSYATNPMNGEKIPIWAGNFVVADYGSGMVMGVPAHDQRDFEFAEKYDIPIKIVVNPKNIEVYERKGQIPRAYTEEGTLENSGDFNGMESKVAREKITEHLKREDKGKEKIQYKMRDWLISRQRYWGTPIPIIYCDECGIVPVPEEDLPVKLPEKVKFGKGNPLETNEKFLKTKCPKCGEKGRRETDTMDTFFDSSWYYLRYLDSKNNKEPFKKKHAKKWMPVDKYIGGVEHATMHLIYARFFTKALRDLGYLEIDEPFKSLFNQGMLHGEDGYVMSKSRGNVILPEKVSKKYGMDTARLFLVSIGSADKDIEWSDKGIEGSLRFIRKVVKLSKEIKDKNKKLDELTKHKLNKTIKLVEQNVKEMRYDLAVISIRELFSHLERDGNASSFKKFLKILHPFCPHLTEELWEGFGNKKMISLEKWPKVDESKINPSLEKEEEAIENLIEDINHVSDLVEVKPKKAFVYALPQEKKLYSDKKGYVESKINLKMEIYAVNDKDKYDPENKSKKAKPGKPGIYLE